MVSTALALNHPISIRFGRGDTDMAKMLRARAKATKRAASDLMKYYAYIGMIADDNPDLPCSMIEGILEAREEFKAGLGKPYEWGVIR